MKVSEEIFCAACGICIGPNQMERYSHEVGEHALCGRCLRFLKRRGRIEIARDGRNMATYLLPSGNTIKEKIKLDGGNYEAHQKSK